jgi:serine/threonine protein phosphatase PrpC
MTWTDLGFVHEKNRRNYQEDSILISKDFNTLAVADGMGGHANGAAASAETLQLLSKCLEIHQRPMTELELRASVLSTNDIIMRHRDRRGTTLSLLSFPAEAVARVAHAGDSVILRVRAAGPPRNSDFQMISDQVEVQKLTPTQGFQNILYVCIGQELQPDDVFVHDYDTQAGDIFIVATDGLYCGKNCQSTKEETSRLLEQVHQLVVRDLWLENKMSCQQMAEDLAGQARELGSSDNQAVLVVRL